MKKGMKTYNRKDVVDFMTAFGFVKKNKYKGDDVVYEHEEYPKITCCVNYAPKGISKNTYCTVMKAVAIFLRVSNNYQKGANKKYEEILKKLSKQFPAFVTDMITLTQSDLQNLLTGNQLKLIGGGGDEETVIKMVKEKGFFENNDNSKH